MLASFFLLAMYSVVLALMSYVRFVICTVVFLLSFVLLSYI